MSVPWRLAPRVCRFCRASPAVGRRSLASASPTTKDTTRDDKTVWPQRTPRGEYYDILLRDPTPYASTKAEKPPSSAAAAAEPQDKTPPEAAPSTASSSTTSSRSPAKSYDTIASRTAYSGASDATTAEERARIIFGSRLLGPAERADRAAGRTAKSTTIAGVLVPPRPEEPDNCCMSGCVNCVWDLYREDMEEWTLAANEAKKRLAEDAAAAASSGEAVGAAKKSAPPPAPSAVSMDDDGGGSESNWVPSAPPPTPPPAGSALGGESKIAKDMWADDVFQNVPVGIREFMKQEKRLKEKHQREGTSGG